MEFLPVAILAVVVIALATAIAPRLGIAGPLILVGIGLGVSVLPFVPAFFIEPEIILVGVLPPLLYSTAVSLPAIEFRRDFRPIAGLSVLLVVFSAVALGLFTWVIPDLGFFLALALGAILSPTDAVATSIVKRLGIAPRVVTMLEGESLLNDATSLVLLRTSIAAVGVAGATAGTFLSAFVWGVLIAIVLGAIIGWLNLRIRARIGNSAATTALSFVVPFVAYLPTEHLGGSGLVAAVVAGLVTGQGAARWFTPEQRLSDELNWRTVELVLEGAVFLVMGLELKELLRANVEADEGLWHAVRLALVAMLIILVVRAAYVAILVLVQGRRANRRRESRLDAFVERLDEVERRSASPDARLPTDDPRFQRAMGRARDRLARGMADLDYYRATPIGWRHGTVIVWAGMRGVVTLAAAQTLPRDTPERELLVLVAFIVAVGGLMLQGFTLPWLVRMLGLRRGDGDASSGTEQRELSGLLRDAAAEALASGGVRRRDGSAFPDHVREKAGDRMTAPPDDDKTARAREFMELRLAVIRVMRQKLIELSSGGTFSTAVLRHSLAELDADELSLELRLDGED